MDTQELRQQLADDLLDQDGVSGVGIGQDDDGNEIVVVNVEAGRAGEVTLPQGVDAATVDIRETGPFYAEVAPANPQAIDRQGKHRPVPGGVSAGHKDITAGTTGFIVADDSGTEYTASNNHVYANVNAGSEGDAITQPGSADGGTVSDDQSATLAGYVPIEDGVRLDFAWANQSADHLVEIGDLGKPQGEPVEPTVGETVTKAGRTTGITEGEIQQVNVDIDVGYGGGQTIRINDTFITGNMSDGGDSGSAVVVKDTMEPVGILFAGSDSATAMNPAVHVSSDSPMSIVTAGDGGNEPPSAMVTLTLEQETSDTGNMVVATEDQDGLALAGVDVTVTGETDLSGVTDETGTVMFESVPIGSYTVTGTKDGYTDASATVTSDDWS